MALTEGEPLKEGSKQGVMAYWTASAMPFMGKLSLKAADFLPTYTSQLLCTPAWPGAANSAGV